MENIRKLLPRCRISIFLVVHLSSLFPGVWRLTGPQECALSLYNLLEMLDHNIDNFTFQTGTDYSGNNYVVDKNIILGLICLAEVRCGDVSQ